MAETHAKVSQIPLNEGTQKNKPQTIMKDGRPKQAGSYTQRVNYDNAARYCCSAASCMSAGFSMYRII